MRRRLQTAARFLVAAAVIATGFGTATMPLPAFASGGSGGGGVRVDSIRVSKAYYFDTGSYVELLIKADSSVSSARLYAYLPDGHLLGEIPNGGGGRYGGTVFLSMYIPETITILSSAGGAITVATAPFQF
jgi:hypothetical protein